MDTLEEIAVENNIGTSSAWPHYRVVVRPNGKQAVLLPPELFDEVAEATRPKGHHRIGMNAGGPTSGLCEVEKDGVRFLWDYTCWESNWPVFALAVTVPPESVVWKLPHLSPKYEHVLNRLIAGISDELAEAAGIDQRDVPLAILDGEETRYGESQDDRQDPRQEELRNWIGHMDTQIKRTQEMLKDMKRNRQRMRDQLK